jgi:GNAT superfamily N-acetyltransferase
VLVRDRRAGDEPQLLEIAQLVHVQDGYPLYLPDGDYRTFLFGRHTLGAWVAEHDDEVFGQVALHPRSSAQVMDLAAQALAQPADRLAVVARLLVHPDRRRIGVGAALLARAAHEAVSIGRWPVLDVAQELTAAVVLYERQGWQRLGSVSVTFREAVTIEEFVYLAPPALRPA